MIFIKRRRVSVTYIQPTIRSFRACAKEVEDLLQLHLGFSIQMAKWVIKLVISQYLGKPLWDKMAAVFKGTKIINIPHTMERRLGNDCDSLGPLTT
jgi:hypothetical protein